MNEFEDYFDLDEVKAKVYLRLDGDSNNMIMLTDEKLMLKNKGKKQVYDLSGVKSLGTGNKKLLLPLLLGAVTAPFSFISYFTNIFHPMIHLIFTLLGLLLFFIGWMGRATLVVQLPRGHEDFIFLPSITKNISAFIEYVNHQLGMEGNNAYKDLIFVEKDIKGMRWLYDEKTTEKHFPIFGYTYQQVQQHPNLKDSVIAIDPYLAKREIKFEFDDATKMMRPKIEGTIDKKSITEIQLQHFS